MTQPISRYPVPEVLNLPDDLRQRVLDVQAKAGFVPNVFLGFSHRPEEARQRCCRRNVDAHDRDLAHAGVHQALDHHDRRA